MGAWSATDVSLTLWRSPLVEIPGDGREFTALIQQYQDFELWVTTNLDVWAYGSYHVYVEEVARDYVSSFLVGQRKGVSL